MTPKWHQRQVDVTGPFRCVLERLAKAFKRQPKTERLEQRSSWPERSNYSYYRPPNPDPGLSPLPQVYPTGLPATGAPMPYVDLSGMAVNVTGAQVWMPPVGWIPSGEQGYYVATSGVGGYTYRRKPRLFPEETNSTGPR